MDTEKLKEQAKPGEPRMPGRPGDPPWTWQILSRNVTLDAAVARAIADLFAVEIEPLLPKDYQIGALETGGIPIALAIQHFHRPAIKVFQIRKAYRTVGIRNCIEGEWDPHLPVLLVDDCSNTGDQFAHGLRILADHGLTPTPIAFALLTRFPDTAEAQAGFPTGRATLIRSLFRYDALDRYWRDYAAAKGLEPRS